ncbi:beta-ketoacyl synthase N-terminal-like domain-containing protein [Azonexus sp.]|uniref:beta-ketoacyl synthase N-terminal-like domain-containing protein n=1 Tax=Azonexus sp. TaxID=1872668 RepID=UPI0027BA5909|nr:beta-ketoacyl synthase N-terminal-like domain-containing protein [Azonexus sp.]
MPSCRAESTSPVVTGIGVATGFGYGKAALLAGMWSPQVLFADLCRPGRQIEGREALFRGTELAEPPALLTPRVARVSSLGGRVAVAVLDEAWHEAALDSLAPERIGLVVGGSNLNAREQMLNQQSYAGRMSYLLPSHGYTCFDTDLCGLCAAHFPIRGFAYTVGGASASGVLAVLQATEAVRSGRVDACIALGALQDISCFELQALSALGVLSPGLVCRPFDHAHDGFMFGESCAALVISRPESGLTAYGSVAGGAHVANGHRGPDPSLEGEVRAIQAALAQAGLTAADIDYVNTHGTGTPRGDETELAALQAAGLGQARLNASKSLIGHGLSAAGVVETAMLLLQMRAGRLHPTLHLENPLLPELDWVRDAAQPHACHHALKLAFGFGGFDSALVISALTGA